MNLLDRVRAFLSSRGIRAYLVGGSVRDLLMRRERYDIDIAVEANAKELARGFADEHGGLFYIMSEEFETARVLLPTEGGRLTIDFAALRGGSIESDLATRDFSINAMALDLSRGVDLQGSLIDPFHGQSDLAALRLRTVADSVFANDPVRLLRAPRFEVTLGVTIAPSTESRIQRDADKLSNASPERIRDELYKVLAGENPAKAVSRLDELGLLVHLLPEVVSMKGITQGPPHVHDLFEHSIATVAALADVQRENYAGVAEGGFATQLRDHFETLVSGDRRRGLLLRIAALLHDTGKPGTRTISSDGQIHFYRHETLSAEISAEVLRRLRFSNDEVDLLTTIAQHHLRPIWLSTSNSVADRSIYRYFRATGDAGVDIAVLSICAQRATYGEASRTEADLLIQPVAARLLDRFFNARQQVVEPPRLIDGSDLMKALGIKPGPQVGELLEAVREAQVTGAVQTRVQALELVHQIQAQRQAGRHQARESG